MRRVSYYLPLVLLAEDFDFLHLLSPPCRPAEHSSTNTRTALARAVGPSPAPPPPEQKKVLAAAITEKAKLFLGNGDLALSPSRDIAY